MTSGKLRKKHAHYFCAGHINLHSRVINMIKSTHYSACMPMEIMVQKSHEQSQERTGLSAAIPESPAAKHY